MKKTTFALLLLLSLTATSCAYVRRRFDGAKDGIVTGTTAGYFFQEENDSLAPGNRDKFYTQGLRWGKTVNPNKVPAVNKFAQSFCGIFCKQLVFDNALWTSGIGSTIYTPDDIAIDGPQPHDRPWAGFIYLDNTLRITEAGDDPHTQIVIELQTGTIGKRSGAEWAQSALHAIIDSAHPTWHDQLERGLGIEVIYVWNKRWGNKFVDILPYGGGAFGSTQWYLNTGANVRLGWNLPLFFSTGPMQGTFAVGRDDDDRRPVTDGFLYAGGNAAWIPYNYFLSKGDFKRERKVHDFMAGASFRYRSYRLTYNFVRRSREISHPLMPLGAHDYASLVLSYELVIPNE